MSTVIALAKDGVVYMGADSAATAGNHQRILEIGKIFKPAGEQYLVGTVGNLRYAQILECVVSWPGVPGNATEAFAFVVQYVVPALRQGLRDSGMMQYEQGAEVAPDGSSCLVGFAGLVFEVDPLLSVSPTVGYSAIGSGSQYAMGAMAVLPEKLKPEKRLQQALEAAAAYDIYTSAPFAYGRLG